VNSEEQSVLSSVAQLAADEFAARRIRNSKFTMRRIYGPRIRVSFLADETVY
jgi:hypothetical protein